MTNERIRHLILSISLFVVAISSTQGCSEQPRRTERQITIAAVPAAFYLPLMVAHDQGFFEELGYTTDLVIFNSVNDQMNAVLRGDADLGGIGSGGLFALEAQSPGTVQLVYGQNNRSYSFLVRPDSEIDDYEALRGKRIGTWPSPTPQVFIHLLLDPILGRDGFSIVPIEFRFLGQGLKSGDVDALFNTDVFTQQAIELGVATYLSRYPLEDLKKPFFNGGGIVRKDLQTRRPGVYDAIQKALPEVLSFIETQNEAARRSLVRHVGVSESVAMNAPMDAFVSSDRIDLRKAQQVADLLTEAGVVSKSIKVQGLIREDAPQ